MPGENLLEYSFWRYSENILPAFITTSGGWFFIQKGSVSMKAITVLLTATLFSVSASAALTPTCEEYYKEIDNFVAKMKETGTPEAQLNRGQFGYRKLLYVKGGLVFLSSADFRPHSQNFKVRLCHTNIIVNRSLYPIGSDYFGFSYVKLFC